MLGQSILSTEMVIGLSDRMEYCFRNSFELSFEKEYVIFTTVGASILTYPAFLPNSFFTNFSRFFNLVSCQL